MNEQELNKAIENNAAKYYNIQDQRYAAFVKGAEFMLPVLMKTIEALKYYAEVSPFTKAAITLKEIESGKLWFKKLNALN